MTRATGKVYLVGAGPGDPGLLTLRGKDVLERADVVVYDGLVNEAILRHAANAERIFVGKEPGRHTLKQGDIETVLIEQARRVKNVVRLKGGDPLVFGRGGEEAAALAREGIPFEIVPGITAGLAAAAYAGIPITHRGVSSSITFLTGHLDPSSESDDVALEKIHLEGTLAIYMGLENIRAITENLIRLGRPRSTPVAVIERATLPSQRTITGTLETIHEQCHDANFQSPVVIIVGDVVALRDAAAWFEDRPMFGRRVAVTRARRRAQELIRLLYDLGADVFEFPTVQIDPLEDPEPLGDISAYDWIVLTSVNGADMLFERLADQGQDARALHGVRLCAVGAKTVEAVEARFLKADVASTDPNPEAVLALLIESGGSLSNQSILLPRADIAQSALPKTLRNAGAQVHELRAYRAAPPKDSTALADALLKFAPHYVTFNSASAARNFHAILGAGRVGRLAAQTTFAAIGPIAAAEAAGLGMAVDIVPDEHRVPHLVDALAEWDAAHR